LFIDAIRKDLHPEMDINYNSDISSIFVTAIYQYLDTSIDGKLHGMLGKVLSLKVPR